MLMLGLGVLWCAVWSVAVCPCCLVADFDAEKTRKDSDCRAGRPAYVLLLYGCLCNVILRRSSSSWLGGEPSRRRRGGKAIEASRWKEQKDRQTDRQTAAVTRWR